MFTACLKLTLFPYLDNEEKLCMMCVILYFAIHCCCDHFRAEFLSLLKTYNVFLRDQTQLHLSYYVVINMHVLIVYGLYISDFSPCRCICFTTGGRWSGGSRRLPEYLLGSTETHQAENTGWQTDAFFCSPGLSWSHQSSRKQKVGLISNLLFSKLNLLSWCRFVIAHI